MKKNRLVALVFAGALFSFNSYAQNFADGFIFYNPGSNFSSGFTNASTSLGQPTATANPFSPAFRNTQLVSLGTGGSLTVQFNTPITNDPAHPFGLDFTIFGNSGFVITNGNFSGGGITDGSLFGNNTGATRVWVSADNLNYFELNPLLAPVVDGLFPTDGAANFLKPVNPVLGQSAFAGQNLAGIRALYDGSAGGSSYDISWAEDSLGNAVALNTISFIRVDVSGGKSEIDGFSIVAVPEPGTAAIFATGLLLLFFGRRLGRTSVLTAVIFVTGATVASAGVFSESFATDPSSRWLVFGDSNLFHWDATNHDLQVTWDSSQSNSYFYHPLGTILGIADDFDLQFDVRMSDAVATGDGFETAIGFLNIGDAMKPTFLRGTGFSSPNIAEFNLFPDTGFGPSITASIADTNSQFQFLFDFLGLDNGVDYHVVMLHNAGASNFVVQVLTNFPDNPGLYSSMPYAFTSSNFTDFRMDTISINSYYDGGTGSSILAHGIVANLTVKTPLPPIQDITGGFNNGAWQVQFTSQSNWVYTLERSAELQAWSSVSATASGNGGTVILQDTNAPVGKAFYRVRANRP